MERKSCCGYSIPTTPKKEPVVTPKKEDAKPVVKKEDAPAVPSSTNAMKTPKAEEKETATVKKEPVKVSKGCGGSSS
ncbi:hypothetical protein SLEP1_g28829 [Rubroshorea leprosula]|uniref:Uncharacterized protein n=1 Tax=Rubroshorea leprosula TaxID=152421 RepID=A0AAV5K5I7_9ROSI|nr:hypothetical protein SLEP1_g28829 [Rubroshorea leprosula]